MIIRNERLLSQFRAPGDCEWCRRSCRKREAAHVFACGRGFRLDIRINLVALGIGQWSGRAACHCHALHHNGDRPLRCDLLAVACAREGVLQRDAEAVIYLLRRIPKRPTQTEMERECQQLNMAQLRLLQSTIGER